MENMNNNNDIFDNQQPQPMFNQQPNGGFESTLEDKPNNSGVAKGCCLGATIMLLIMIIIGVCGFLFVKNDFYGDDRSSYNAASTLNEVIEIDNAITTDIKVNEKGVAGYKVVEVKVTNNTDKYINNYMYSLPMSNGTYVEGMLSIRPNDSGLLGAFSVEEERIKTYEEGFDLKTGLDYENNDLGSLTDEALENVIYLNDIKLTTTYVDQNQLKVEVKNNSKVDVWLNRRDLGIVIRNDLNGTTSSEEFVAMTLPNDDGDIIETIHIKPGSSREVYVSPRFKMNKLDKDLNNEVVINNPFDLTK